MSLRHLGLRSRLLLGAVLPALLMVGLLEALFLNRYRADLERSFVARGESIARQLGPAVEYALFSGSAETLTVLAEATRRSDPAILSVSVQDRLGRLLVRSGFAAVEQPALVPALTVERMAERLIVIAPVMQTTLAALRDLPEWQDGAASLAPVVGYVVVELSHGEIEERQREMVHITLLIILGGLLLASWLSFGLAAKLLSSLDAALEAAQRQKAAAEALARTDTLTGIANRRAFDEAAELEIRRALRYGTPLALILTDIDHFKSINDRFGHHVGDAVLKDFAATLCASVREVDRVGRWGGEEFAILMPNADLAQAREAAERMRLAVAGRPTRCAGGTCGYTASFGVAALAPDAATLSALLNRADAALYRAKAQGRNRVETG